MSLAVLEWQDPAALPAGCRSAVPCGVAPMEGGSPPVYRTGTADRAGPTTQHFSTAMGHRTVKTPVTAASKPQFGARADGFACDQRT